MSVDTLTAAFPLPIDADGRSHDTLEGELLDELHRRIDALPERVLAACNEAIAGEGDEDEQAEVGREFLRAGVTDVLTTEGSFMSYALELDHRVWFVGGGLTAGDIPYNFEQVAAIALSGITDEPIGLSKKASHREAKRRRRIKLEVGEQLVAILRQRLAVELAAAVADPKHRAALLAAVDAAVAERSDDLVQVTGLVLRGGRADWLEG